MMRWMIVLTIVFSLNASIATAGPAEDAVALVEQWSRTYSDNDRNALARLYADDAILLGTTDPPVSYTHLTLPTN